MKISTEHFKLLKAVYDKEVLESTDSTEVERLIYAYQPLERIGLAKIDETAEGQSVYILLTSAGRKAVLEAK